MTTTTWSWSPSNPRHLVITQPAAKRAVVVTRTAPSGWEGQTLTQNQTSPSLSAGHKVLVVCTAAPVDGRHLTELNTGAWVASADLEPITLPDCDAKSPTSTSTTTTTAVTPTTTQGSTAGTCATASQLLTVYNSTPGYPPGITGFSTPTCWSNWVVAFGLGQGNGSIVFSTTGGLHVASSSENSAFGSQVCSDPSAPGEWKNSPDIAGCNG